MPSKKVVDAFMEYTSTKTELIYGPQDDCACELCEKLRVSLFTEQLLGTKNNNTIRVPIRINHYFERRSERKENSLSCQEKNPKSKP